MSGVSRRYQPLPAVACCTRPGCGWADPLSASGITIADPGEHDRTAEAFARAHVIIFGHAVTLLRTQQVVLRPQPAEVMQP